MENLAAQACGCPLAAVTGGREWQCPGSSLPGPPSGPPAYLPYGPPGRALGLWPGSLPKGVTTLWRSSVDSKGPSKVPADHQTCLALSTPSSILAIVPGACVPVPHACCASTQAPGQLSLGRPSLWKVPGAPCFSWTAYQPALPSRASGPAKQGLSAGIFLSWEQKRWNLLEAAGTHLGEKGYVQSGSWGKKALGSSSPGNQNRPRTPGWLCQESPKQASRAKAAARCPFLPMKSRPERKV